MSTDETGDGNLVDGKDSEGVIPPATSNVIKLVPRDTGSTGPTSAEEIYALLGHESAIAFTDVLCALQALQSFYGREGSNISTTSHDIVNAVAAQSKTGTIEESLRKVAADAGIDGETFVLGMAGACFWGCNSDATDAFLIAVTEIETVLPAAMASCGNIELVRSGVEKAVHLMSILDEGDEYGHRANLVFGLCWAAEHLGHPDAFLAACEMIPSTAPLLWEGLEDGRPFDLTQRFARSLAQAGELHAAKALLQNAIQKSLEDFDPSNPASLPYGAREIIQLAGNLEQALLNNIPLPWATDGHESEPPGRQADERVALSLRSVQAETVLYRKYDLNAGRASAAEYLEGIGVSSASSPTAVADFTESIVLLQGARNLDTRDLAAQAVLRLFNGVLHLFAETSGASPGMGGKWPRDRKLYLEYAAALPALRALRPTEQLIRRCNGAVNRLTACRNKVAHAIHGPPSIEEVGVCLGEWFGNGPDTGKPTLLGDLFTLLNRRE